MTSFTLLYFAVFAVSCAEISTRANVAPSPNRTGGQILIDIIELPRTVVNRFEQTGIVSKTNIPFRIVVDRQSGVDSQLLLETRGQAVNVDLSARAYPMLDLTTLESNSENNSEGLHFIISIKYGQETGCFADDDGRNRIRLHVYEHSAPILDNMTFADCEPRHEETPLSSR
jgi:hypothetical protein